MEKMNVNEIIHQALDAAKRSLGNKLPQTLDYVEKTIKQLGIEMADVEAERVTGQMDDDTVRLIMDTEMNAVRTVEITGECIVKVAAEQAINAALDVVKKEIGKVLGAP